MSDKKVLAATPVLQSALTNLINPQGYRVDYPSAPQRRSSISDTDNNNGRVVDSKYNGAFTVNVVPEYGANRKIISAVITVENGLDPSFNQTCKVNNDIFYLSAWKSSKITSSFNAAVRLKYTPQGTANVSPGSEPSKATVVIEAVSYQGSGYSDTADNAFYHLAFVYVDFSTGKIQVSQDHLTGAAVFYHILTCPVEKMLDYY